MIETNKQTSSLLVRLLDIFITNISTINNNTIYRNPIQKLMIYSRTIPYYIITIVFLKLSI